MWRYRVDVPTLREASVTGVMSRNYRIAPYRYQCCTYTDTGSGTDVHTGTGGTGREVVPHLPKCPVPVLMSYRTYRSIRYRLNYRSIRYRRKGLYRYRRYRYPYRTELSEVSSAGFDVIPNLPNCPVPVLMSYRRCVLR